MTVYVNNKISNDLTKKTDTVVVTGDGKDTVYGNLYLPLTSPYSTVTPGDKITGNGKTVLSVDATGWSDNNSFPGMTVSGVKTLNLNNLDGHFTSDDLLLNAASWGTDLQKINVSGAAGLNLVVNGLTSASGKLLVTASGSNQGVDIFDATVGGSTVSVNLANSTSDSTSAKAVVNADKILAKGGGDDVVLVTHNHTVSGSVAAESIGTLQAVSGSTGESDVNFIHNAYATGAATSVGSVSVDLVKLQGGNSDVFIHAHAKSITSGDATVNSLFITNVEVDGNAAAASALAIDNWAEATTGNATVGLIDITKIDVSLAKGGAAGLGAEIDIQHEATTVTGNALVADATIGGVSAVIGSGQDVDLDLYQYAATTTGNAAVGKLSMGAVEIVATGDGDYADDVLIQRTALTSVGNAAVAATTIGDISVANNDVDLDILVNATVASGAYAGVAAVGDVKLGKVTATGTGSEDFDMNVDVGTVGGSWSDNNVIGKFTSGAVSSTTASGNSTYALDISAANGAVGDVDVGSVALTSSAAVATISADVNADNSIGAVKIGSLSATGSGSALTVTVGGESTANVATIGNVTIGDLSTSSKSNVLFNVNVTPGTGTVGNVSVGNVSADVKASGTLDTAAEVRVGSGIASTTKVGNVSIGNITLSGATGSTVGDLDVAIGGKVVGTTSVGNVSVTAGWAVNAIVDMDVEGDTALGNVTVGAITVGSGGSTSTAGYNLDVGATHTDANISTGAISVSAAGSSTAGAGTQGAEVTLVADGRVTAGNITATVSGGAGGGNISEVLVDAHSSSTGAIQTGNINASAIGSATSNADAIINIGDATDISVATGSIAASSNGLGADTTVTIQAGGGGVLVAGASELFASTSNTDLNVNATGGAVVMGAIKASAIGVGPSSIDAAVTGTTVAIQNITVVGSATLDDLDDIGLAASSWLAITATAGTVGQIQVGNIDYRGYIGASTIDLYGITEASQWNGASNIYASQGGSNITGNRGVNNYYLDTVVGGVDTIYYLAAGANTQNWTSSAIGDAGLAANADFISKFTGGVDEINIVTSSTTEVVDGGTDLNYADFLVQANAEIGTTVGGNTVNAYFAKITGTSTYWVAVDADGNDSIDYVVQVDAIGTIVAGDIV